MKKLSSNEPKVDWETTIEGLSADEKANCYREALQFVMKNLRKGCFKRKKIEEGIEEIRREFFK